MIQKVMGFPDQVAEAFQITQNRQVSKLKLNNTISNIVILGMGGSGMAGDFARTLLKDSLPIQVCKNAVPPRFINNESLVIAVSYSGRTIETLHALEAAQASGASTLVLTSSVELGSICEKKQIQWIKIPGNNYPRVSIAYMLIPMLSIFARLGLMKFDDSDIAETISTLAKIRDDCGPYVQADRNPAHLLALRIAKGLPVIFGEYGFTDVIALRWKQLLNENSKTHCYCDAFPELLHNEIEAWGANTGGSGNNAVLVLLRDATHEREAELAEKIEAAKELILNKGKNVFELWSSGKTELARLLSLSYLGDFVSSYLALLNGVDPVDVHNIEIIKKMGLPIQPKG